MRRSNGYLIAAFAILAIPFIAMAAPPGHWVYIDGHYYDNNTKCCCCENYHDVTCRFWAPDDGVTAANIGSCDGYLTCDTEYYYFSASLVEGEFVGDDDGEYMFRIPRNLIPE